MHSINGNDLSLGRYHGSANRALVTEFHGDDPCTSVRLEWDDGAHVLYVFDGPDMKREALDCIANLGFTSTQP